MGILGALIKTVVNVTTLPIDVAMDIVTLGGVTTDQKKPYTSQKLDQIKEDVDDV